MVVYKPSPYHKNAPGQGILPVHRPGASICPPAITLAVANMWLQAAAANGFHIGNPPLPQTIYYYQDQQFYMAKLTNKINSEYHGFPCDSVEVPTQIKKKMRKLKTITQEEFRKYL